MDYIVSMTNKEYRKQYNKAYHQKHRERLQQIQKQWRDENGDKFKQLRKNNELNNPDSYKQYREARYSRVVLPYHIVYLLPDHNYVGVTNQPDFRMYEHKNNAKRNTDNWIELARYDDRKEALAHEARLHSEGYEGAKVGYNT